MDAPKAIVVRHTADRMKALVSLSPAFGPVTAGAVLTELLHNGVVHGLNTAVIHKFVGLSLFNKFVEVATGTVAAPGTDGRIDILVSGFRPADALAAMVPGRAAKPKPLCQFVAVKAGTVLARRVPPVPGTDGMDVFGTPITAPPVRDTVLPGGSGTVIMSGDPNILLAQHDGVFRFGPDGMIEICPYMEVEGDVGGDISFDGCLKVAGAVRSGFSIDVAGSLLVVGEVQDAEIKCGGDLVMREGARGHDMLTIDCGGSVQAAYLTSAKLKANGAVTVSGDITDSDVDAKGVVRASRIIGGSVTAAGGIYASQVGDENKSATILDVGVVYRYAKERENAKSGIGTQNLLAEGYISELYCYVRDNIDYEGLIPLGAMPAYDQYRKNLDDSLALCEHLEKDIERLDVLLKEAEGCCILVSEVHPNVSLRLGFSEQVVREVLKNVNLRPVVA